MSQDPRFIRNALLLQQDNIERLANTKVMVFGVGGVGGYAVEAFARLGVGHLVLVDKDKLDISNMNRQIIALDSTIGKEKVHVFEERLHSINPSIQVDAIVSFFDESKVPLLDEYQPDYVVDAIDTISAKWSLIKACLEKQIPFISSTGMANRLNPLKVDITTLDHTSGDPICKILRSLAKHEQIDARKIPVVFSTELPIKQTIIVNQDGKTRKEQMPPSSIILTPASAGLACAYYVLNDIISK